jgi:hypothetical protein
MRYMTGETCVLGSPCVREGVVIRAPRFPLLVVT